MMPNNKYCTTCRRKGGKYCCTLASASSLARLESGHSSSLSGGSPAVSPSKPIMLCTATPSLKQITVGRIFTCNRAVQTARGGWGGGGLRICCLPEAGSYRPRIFNTSGVQYYSDNLTKSVHHPVPRRHQKADLTPHYRRVPFLPHQRIATKPPRLYAPCLWACPRGRISHTDLCSRIIGHEHTSIDHTRHTGSPRQLQLA